MNTSWTALRLALPGFIIPFIIAYDPILLLDTTDGPINYLRLLWVVITAIIGVYALAVGLGKFIKVRLNILEQIILLAVAFLLITINQMMDIIGLVLFAVVISVHYLRSRKRVSASNGAN